MMTGDRALSGVRVVVVNNFPGPGMGGGEVLVLAVCRALVASGASLAAVLAPQSGLRAPLEDLGAEVVEVRQNLEQLPVAVEAIGSLVAGADRAVLVGSGYFSNLTTRLALPQATRYAKPGARVRVLNIAAVAPGASSTEGEGKLKLAARRWVDRATSGRVDAYVAVSAAVEAGLVAQGAPPDRIRTILNGVDVEAVRREAEEHANDAGDAVAQVVCVGRLMPVKGIEYLIRAAVHVPDARFVIAGEGPLEPELRQLVDSLGLSERVRFAGYVSSAAAVLAAADVVAMPSLSEGLPLVAIEAGALGKPVVATRVGGIPEIVEDGVTGLLVPPEDPGALGTAIRRLLEDEGLRLRMGAAAAERVERHFDVHAMGDAYVGLVAELTSRGDKTAGTDTP